MRIFATQFQIKELSKLSLDLGKIIIGTVVVGFFILSMGITLSAFIGGIVAAFSFFSFGIFIVSSN